MRAQLEVMAICYDDDDGRSVTTYERGIPQTEFRFTDGPGLYSYF
jgi:hypothetical protein